MKNYILIVTYATGARFYYFAGEDNLDRLNKLYDEKKRDKSVIELKLGLFEEIKTI